MFCRVKRMEGDWDRPSSFLDLAVIKSCSVRDEQSM